MMIYDRQTGGSGSSFHPQLFSVISCGLVDPFCTSYSHFHHLYKPLPSSSRLPSVNKRSETPHKIHYIRPLFFSTPEYESADFAYMRPILLHTVTLNRWGTLPGAISILSLLSWSPRWRSLVLLRPDLFLPGPMLQ